MHEETSEATKRRMMPTMTRYMDVPMDHGEQRVKYPNELVPSHVRPQLLLAFLQASPRRL